MRAGSPDHGCGVVDVAERDGGKAVASSGPVILECCVPGKKSENVGGVQA